MLSLSLICFKLTIKDQGSNNWCHFCIDLLDLFVVFIVFCLCMFACKKQGRGWNKLEGETLSLGWMQFHMCFLKHLVSEQVSFHSDCMGSTFLQSAVLQGVERENRVWTGRLPGFTAQHFRAGRSIFRGDQKNTFSLFRDFNRRHCGRCSIPETNKEFCFQIKRNQLQVTEKLRLCRHKVSLENYENNFDADDVNTFIVVEKRLEKIKNSKVEFKSGSLACTSSSSFYQTCFKSQ